jgi:uncharacterized membrane protein YcaP (DUF421 family)
MPTDGPRFLAAIAARTLIVLLALVIGLRVLGKRQTAQFNIYDLGLIMLLANAVQNAMTNGDGHLLTGVVSAGTLLTAGWVVSRAFQRLPTLEQRIAGASTLLLSNGQFIASNLRRENVTKDQVLAAMRQHGLCDLGDVRMAVLEVDGSISVVPTRAPHHECDKVAKQRRRRD